VNFIKSFFSRLFGNPNKDEIINNLLGILNPQDFEIIAVRGKSCRIVFANETAKSRTYTQEGHTDDCKVGLSKNFPSLCQHCPHSTRKNEIPSSFEIKDINNRTYQASFSDVKWVDGAAATVFVFNDITFETEAKNKLFRLAYIDQLTGVPNRQKLKEDFSALEEKIENNELTGIVSLFDLDHFKAINDTYGHNTGDIVLRRLAEHFEGDSDFNGHLYRLGGDEFVLLFSDPVERFSSPEEVENHYSNLLNKTLRSYSLPNIELKCTLSMGVTSFPKNGTNLSELMRKADIALYQAKEAGRNQIHLFIDKYETSPKFKDVYINIKPILCKDDKTFGYELTDDTASSVDDDDTVKLQEFNRTLEAIGLNNMEEGKYYFIPYSLQLLNPMVLKNLPVDKLVIQVNTKTIASSDLEQYKNLRSHGYKLALFELSSDSPNIELIRLADYCKFSADDDDLKKQRVTIAENSDKGFIATDVNSISDYKVAKSVGFQYFQGFYFNQPVKERRDKEINPLKINYMRLLKLSNADDYMDFSEISNVISSDVALTYKLLRILNSAAVGLRNVSSISAAVAYLGEGNLKKWIAVLALRGIAEDKPLELIRLSLIRARFGELLSPHFRVRRNPSKVFMVGLLSLLHIALDVTREQMLEDIPVDDDIRDSFISKDGIYSELLSFFYDYEYSNWELVSEFSKRNSLDTSTMNDAYLESVKWYNDLASDE